MSKEQLQNGDVQFTSPDQTTKDVDQILLEPYNYLQQVQGKNIRRKLLHAFNVWMKVPEGKVEEIASIIQMLHNASLMIDDIEDSSTLRRGIPTSYKIFGEPSTINSANFVMFLALEQVLKLNHPMAATIFCEQILELHRGQGMDIHWRDTYTCPTEDEYKEMSIRKTGGLFCLAIRLMELFSQTPNSNFPALMNLFGLYFQIRDDFANLCLQEYIENKSFAEDLTEGKFSFPIVHAIRSQPSNNVIMNILRKRTTDIEVKKHCITLLETMGSFAYTKEVLEDLDQSIRFEIRGYGGNEPLLKLLDDLKNWSTL